MAVELSERHPLLFRTVIQSVAPQPPEVQRNASRWIREQIAMRAVVNQEKSLELLQVLLLYIGWYVRTRRLAFHC